MDAFDELMVRTRRRQRKKRTAVWVVPALILLALCAAFLYTNHFRIEVTLGGQQEVTLEYGEQYVESGAEAVFTGRFFPGEAVELDVLAEGAVNEETVGTYQITYSASFGIWKTSATRTVHIVDTVAPRILLRSSRATYTIPGQTYEEEGFIASDNYDGDLTDRVVRTEKGGVVTYSVEDSSGNREEITRDIVYYDPYAPELTLMGDETVVMELGATFEDPGFTATDNCDGDLTGRVKVTGSVDIYETGTYELRYYVEDTYDNAASAVRTVEVKVRVKPEPVKPEGKVIYLTFDDGPSAHTPQLLEVLRKYDVKATFFVCKTDYVDTLKDIAADGHSIGIHSVTHDYKSIYASEEAYFADLHGMQRIIEEKTGIFSTLVRFPGGTSNTVSSFNEGIMTRLSQALEELGYQYFDWNVDSDDAGRSRTKDKVLSNVIEGIEPRETAIVLQHDTKDYSVEAVEEIILWGLENGYRFLPIIDTTPEYHHWLNN